MQQTTTVTQPVTGLHFSMEYDTDDPLMVTLRNGDGQLVMPMDVLSMMVRSWELEIIVDHFEHRPVRGAESRPE